jgi:hypothetical protein
MLPYNFYTLCFNETLAFVQDEISMPELFFFFFFSPVFVFHAKMALFYWKVQRTFFFYCIYRSYFIKGT